MCVLAQLGPDSRLETVLVGTVLQTGDSSGGDSLADRRNNTVMEKGDRMQF